MSFFKTRRFGRSRTFSAWSAGLLLACGLLLLPMTALPYGGGGGGGGGSGSAGSVMPEPVMGIENMPVMPVDGYYGSPDQTIPAGPTSPSGPTTPSTTVKVVKGVVKFGIIRGIIAINGPVGWTIWGVDKIVTIKSVVEDLDKKNREYEKTLIKSVGSNMVVPAPDPVEMAPAVSGGGGGGPQEAHTHGVW